MSYPQCLFCKSFVFGRTCLAFPERIPDDVYENKIPHKTAIDGDGGIVFEPRSTTQKNSIQDDIADMFNEENPGGTYQRTVKNINEHIKEMSADILTLINNEK